MDKYIDRIADAPLCKFGEWPNKQIPVITSGVYTVYDKTGNFLYVGMAGASLSESKVESLSKIRGCKSGLFDRLNSHASGYRSGDRFNIYICDLFVMKDLSVSQIQKIASQRLSLDSINKKYIRDNLSYRYIIAPNTSVRAIEQHIQKYGIKDEIPSINGRA